jgi:hypothetical protein
MFPITPKLLTNRHFRFGRAVCLTGTIAKADLTAAYKYLKTDRHNGGNRELRSLTPIWGGTPIWGTGIEVSDTDLGIAGSKLWLGAPKVLRRGAPAAESLAGGVVVLFHAEGYIDARARYEFDRALRAAPGFER